MSIIIIIHHCRLKVTSRPYSIKPTTEIYTTHGSLDIRIDRERRWAHEVHNYESVFTEPATPLWALTITKYVIMPIYLNGIRDHLFTGALQRDFDEWRRSIRGIIIGIRL